MNKAVFLDRDGVINEDFGYVYDKDKFIFKDKVFQTLSYFLSQGYLLIIITNQSGIGRGYYTLEQFHKLSNFMLNELEKEDIKISKIYYCPHSPEENCSCRKPNPKMILEAVREFNIDLNESILIGDKLSDINAGINAGIKKLFLIGDKTSNDFFTVNNIFDIIKYL